MYNLDIVIVEDDPLIGELLTFNLQNSDFEPHLFQNGHDMFEALPQLMPVSLFILDIMLPGIDGFEICRRLKESPDTEAIPVLILSARGAESDRIRGLTIGADDYMSKPFGIRELIARVEALLCRYGRIRTISSVNMDSKIIDAPANASRTDLKTSGIADSADHESVSLASRINDDMSTDVSIFANAAINSAGMSAGVPKEEQRSDIKFGSILIDDLRHRVFVNGVELEMTNREYELLKYLVQHPGVAFSRDQLLHEVWRHEYGFENSDTRTVDIHIYQVRHKIAICDPGRIQIETLRGFGYRMVDTKMQSQKPHARYTGSWSSMA